MSNETKRDVLKKALDFFVMCGLERSINYDMERHQYLSEYDAALPDDLPVIPEDVSEYIKNLWKYHRDLVDVFGKVRDLGITRTEPNDVLLWVANNTDTFARAWVLGVWHVEETGEIVKLEADIQ